LNHSGRTNWCKKGYKQTYDKQKQTSKAIHCRSHISPNTLQVCSRNHYKNATGTRKTRAFFYSDSRAIPVGRCLPASDEKQQHLTRRSAAHRHAAGEHRLTAKTKPLSGKEPCGTGFVNGKCKARPAGAHAARNTDAKNKDLGAEQKLVALNYSYSRR
jgi:hypothetical protein